MFVAWKSTLLPETVVEADKANGFVHLCEQAALMFGSDRHEPTAQRPVVAVRNDGSRIVVLPCTTKDSKKSPDFFELNNQRVMWSRPLDGRTTFACSRYEVIASARVHGKIGIMPHEARIEILMWLRSRY